MLRRTQTTISRPMMITAIQLDQMDFNERINAADISSLSAIIGSEQDTSVVSFAAADGRNKHPPNRWPAAASRMQRPPKRFKINRHSPKKNNIGSARQKDNDEQPEIKKIRTDR